MLTILCWQSVCSVNAVHSRRVDKENTVKAILGNREGCATYIGT